LGVAPELSVNGAGLAIIPAAGASTQFHIDGLRAAARAADCAVCLAQPRVSHDRDTIEAVGTGAIVDSGGNLLAKNDGACGLIVAELDLPAAPATETWEELETVD
jgi:hypothetical protein